MTTVAVVVPLDPATAASMGDRGTAWDYVLRRLIRAGLPVVLGIYDGEWVKARAVGAALDLACADVLVIHDADVVVPEVALTDAIGAVADGDVAWAVPHTLVHRYDQRSTEALYAGDSSKPRTLTRWPYIGVAGGGIVVIRRDVYDDVPLDPRFVGWGGEDQSWGWALETLHGPPRRSPTQLVHLWHPHPMGRVTSPRPEKMLSTRLRSAYRTALGDRDRMRQILSGIVDTEASNAP